MLSQAFSHLLTFLHHCILNINNLDYYSTGFPFLHPFFQILLLPRHGYMTVTCGLLAGLLEGLLAGLLEGLLAGLLEGSFASSAFSLTGSLPKRRLHIGYNVGYTLTIL